jgi:hypothetical protein
MIVRGSFVLLHNMKIQVLLGSSSFANVPKDMFLFEAVVAKLN